MLWEHGVISSSLVIPTTFEASSKGKTWDFGSQNRGSIPLASTKKKNQSYKNMKHFLYFLVVLVALCTPITTAVKSIKFQQQCSGYIKQAADANTVELASERLASAIQYVEDHNLTTGYTSILWKTEDDNIEFWYRNLIACKEELQACADASQLEKSNVLMRVRESLTDESEDGTTLTIPEGISRYPDNTQFAVLNILSILVFAIMFYKFIE